MDRCPVCDRPTTTWKPERHEPVVDDSGHSDTCVLCGKGTGYAWTPRTAGMSQPTHYRCREREVGAYAAASAADPSVCWGGDECRVMHAVDWRARCLDAEGHLFEARHRCRALDAAARQAMDALVVGARGATVPESCDLEGIANDCNAARVALAAALEAAPTETT